MLKSRLTQWEDELNAIRQEALEFAGIGLYRYSFEGAVLLMDRGALRIFELEALYGDPCEVEGKLLSELVVYQGPQGLMRQECRARKEIRGREWVFQTLQGHKKWVMEDSYLVPDARTGQEAIQVIMRDITDRKRTEEALAASERRFREMLEAVQLLAIQVDTDARITFCNDYFCQLSGWNRAEILGRDWFEMFIPPELQDEMRQMFQYVKEPESEIPRHYENIFLTRSGERRIILWSNTILREQDRTVTGLTAIGQDITHRKRAEEMLQRAVQVSDRLRSLTRLMTSCRSPHDILDILLDTALDVCHMDCGGVYLVENGEAMLYQHQGLPQDFIPLVSSFSLNQPEAEYLLAAEHPVDITRHPAHYEELYRRFGIKRIFSAPLRTGDEVLGFLMVASSLREDPEPDCAQLLGMIAIEVSSLLNRLRTEEQLRESEEQYRTTLNSIADAIHVIDREYRIVLINSAFLHWMKSMGMPEPTVGHSLFEVFPFLPLRVREEYDKVFDLGLPFESEESTVIEGQTFITETCKIPIVRKGVTVQIVTIVRNITERKNAEKTLLESEERYRNILQSIQEGYYEVDMRGNLTFFNEPLAAIFGRSSQEMRGLNYREYDCRIDDLDHIIETFKTVYATGQAAQASEWKMERQDGREMTLEVSVSLMRSSEGTPSGFRGIVRDVTERKQAERALLEAEARYRDLFENANDIIYTHDLDGWFTSLNRSGELISGYSREEVSHLRATDIVAPKYRDLVHDMLYRKQQPQDTTRYEAAFVAKDGRIIPVEVSTRLILHDGRAVGIQGSARDITERKLAEEERKRLEAQIQHTQKLEGLGVLAGGIAHDFNNLLVGILGNAGLALSRMPEESPARTYVRRIEETSQRAAELTNQMLAYSGRGTFVVRPINLSKLAQEMGPLLAASISKKAVLRYDCAPDLPLVKGDVTQLHQILMNLITNASDALANHPGIITISTYVMHMDRSYFSKTYLADDLQEGPYVCVAVSDTGCGMEPHIVSRIFDPFYSTKFAGRGLGLAAVLGIVRGHHGAITVYSEPGQGTTFKVLLPIAEYTESASFKTENSLEDADLERWKGTGMLILADDESGVLEVAQEAMELRGFTVLTAENGREAVDLFLSHRAEVRAVLLDLMMPVMNGQEAYEAIHSIAPDLPVILTSGYTEQDTASRFQIPGPHLFIQKPYHPKDLARIFRKALTPP